MSFPFGTILPGSGWLYNVAAGTLTFTSVGTYTFTPNQDISVDYIVVGGGGGGSVLSGGGGGETMVGTINLTSSTSHTITVGAGGAGGTYSTGGNTGSNSFFYSITAIGGGAGGAGGNMSFGGNGGGAGGGTGTFFASPSASRAANGINGGGGGGGGGGSRFGGGGGSGSGFGGGGGGGGGATTGGAGADGGGNGATGTSAGFSGTVNTGGGGGGAGVYANYYGFNNPGGDGGSGVVILSNFDTAPISDICFPKGTPIATDQGFISIEKINPKVNTIRNKSITAITKTMSNDKYLICFEKDAFAPNVPSHNTIISANHCIFYKGEMRKAKWFLHKFENVKKVKYNGEILYNVLLEKHDKMVVNNLICETLHPENRIAKLYTYLQKFNPKEQQFLISQLNKEVNTYMCFKNK